MNTWTTTKEIDQNTGQADAPVRFMGRQPIFDRENRLFGHELLFRPGEENLYSGDLEVATRDVVDHCLLLALPQTAALSFVNCTREALISGIVTLLPPATTVLEILEIVEPDKELLEACFDLKSKGYRFALDDFSPDEVQRPFLAVADFIKIDFLASNKFVRQKIYALAAQSEIRFIAEKVETAEDVEAAMREGCEFFQGYFFCRPTVLRTRVVPQDSLLYLRLLGELSRPEADLDAIERLVMADAPICYRLLRMVNSALYGLRTHIASIRSALLIVGENEFKKLVTVALMGIARTQPYEKTTQMALERAKFCELLAPLLREPPAKLYLLGMLSLLDVILSMPLDQLLEALPLDQDIKDALMGEKNNLRLALDLVRCHEIGDWAMCMDMRASLNLPESKEARMYVEAVHWADKVLKIASE